MADVRVGLAVEGVDVIGETVTPLIEGMILDVPVTNTLELDTVPGAEPNPVDDRDKVVPEAVMKQAVSVLSEGFACLGARPRSFNVPVDHDKLQSITNLSSENSDQALIPFKALI